MPDLGPYAAFIAGAYAAVALVLGGLIAWVLADARRQQRLLAELEAEGVTRRSAKRRRSGSGGAKEARR